MRPTRTELAVRSTIAKARLEAFRADGRERSGPYTISDLLTCADDCISEATARFYFDFAGNRTSELEYAVESLELCVKRLEREQAEIDAAYRGLPSPSARARGVRPPPDPGAFQFWTAPERIRIPAYGSSQ